MTINLRKQIVHQIHIFSHAGKQGVHFVEVGALGPVFEKSAIEPKTNLDVKTESTERLLTFEYYIQ